MKSPQISYEDFMADVNLKLKERKKPKYIDLLNDEQKRMIIGARQKGLSFEKIKQLFQKHFGYDWSLWVFREYIHEQEKTK